MLMLLFVNDNLLSHVLSYKNTFGYGGMEESQLLMFILKQLFDLGSSKLGFKLLSFTGCCYLL